MIDFQMNHNFFQTFFEDIERELNDNLIIQKIFFSSLTMFLSEQSLKTDYLPFEGLIVLDDVNLDVMKWNVDTRREVPTNASIPSPQCSRCDILRDKNIRKIEQRLGYTRSR